MVGLENIPFVPFLRGLVRARRTELWGELKQVVKQNLIEARAAKWSRSFLRAGIFPWSKSLSSTPPPVFQMGTAYWISQAVYVATKIGVVDALDRPRSCEEIAKATGANEPCLFRLLRVLCQLGILREKNGRYELTRVGRPLQRNSPGSLGAMICTLGEIHYEAWGNLLHSVKTGEPAFNNLFGTGLFQYLAKHPDDGKTFNAAMTDFSGLASYAVALAYDFSKVHSIVDVGGGHGRFLRTILEMNPRTQGIVFDLPSVIDGTTQRLAHLNGRCTAVAGDFFAGIPSGADVYILSGVLHDWDDLRSVAILRNCRRALGSTGRVLIVESIVPQGRNASFNTLLDLNMLVMCGGRERTKAEFQDLLQAAELKLERVCSTLSPLKIIEARPTTETKHA